MSSNKLYTTGITTSVKTVEVSSPPTMAVPIGARLSAPDPSYMATGIMPIMEKMLSVRPVIAKSPKAPTMDSGSESMMVKG